MLILKINRDFGDYTPVLEPHDRDVAWPNKAVVGVLTHSGAGGQGGGGHWVAYIRRGGVWWCVDTATDTIIQRNPFSDQVHHQVKMVFLKN